MEGLPVAVGEERLVVSVRGARLWQVTEPGFR